MSQNNETLPLILALICTGAILGGGYWWFNRESVDVTSVPLVTNQNDTNPPTNPDNFANNDAVTFNFTSNVPQGTTININGATSMVQINQAIKKGFEREFPETAIATKARGTEVGIELLQEGKINIAAISRPITEQEQATGLNAVPIAKDAIGREGSALRDLNCHGYR